MAFYLTGLKQWLYASAQVTKLLAEHVSAFIDMAVSTPSPHMPSCQRAAAGKGQLLRDGAASAALPEPWR
jgi:hypothetical protein